ncbi:MAG: HNH endonuclease signature motif containing protein [Acutalibacteraceae bacterium]|nr:HNH endonuclease signature motif containing protein [Acutalibacteraceae bacterium]
MEIIVKIYSCYSLTYSRVYKDIVKRLYGSNVDFNNVKLEVEDISQNGTLSIQSQRSKSSYVTRTVRIYEGDKLSHIVGISNTNYDYDKNQEFILGKSIKKKNSFGGDGYHANTYLLQGINNIINYYFENVKQNVTLSFYLLDTERSYPHNLFNILSYRELETIGFKILNIDMINFAEYENCCNSKLSYKNIAFNTFNKLMRDVAYISSRNTANISSFLKCDETIKTDENGDYIYSVDKYTYTFKSLSAQGYDSLLRCWCMKVLADKENVEIEFRLGKQYFAYEQEERRIASDLTGPIKKTLENAGIIIDYITDETFMRETSMAEETFLRYKAKNELRNQNLFRNNIRKKGIPTECVLCGEDNPSILDAAHLWEVNKIKSASAKQINGFINTNQLLNLIDTNTKYSNELFFKKYSLANSGDNGVWLCKNHHGLFDDNYFCFDSESGKVILHFSDAITANSFIESIKEDFKMPASIFTQATKAFVAQRQLYFTA